MKDRIEQLRIWIKTSNKKNRN